MAENIPNIPTGAVPPKKETGKVQPKKETVRINLPPKPSAAPTIKLPTLPPGGPTGGAPAAPAPALSAAAPAHAASWSGGSHGDASCRCACTGSPPQTRAGGDCHSRAEPGRHDPGCCRRGRWVGRSGNDGLLDLDAAELSASQANNEPAIRDGWFVV